jgi:hypothetical protein
VVVGGAGFGKFIPPSPDGDGTAASRRAYANAFHNANLPPDKRVKGRIQIGADHHEPTSEDVLLLEKYFGLNSQKNSYSKFNAGGADLLRAYDMLSAFSRDNVEINIAPPGAPEEKVCPKHLHTELGKLIKGDLSNPATPDVLANNTLPLIMKVHRFLIFGATLDASGKALIPLASTDGDAPSVDGRGRPADVRAMKLVRKQNVNRRYAVEVAYRLVVLVDETCKVQKFKQISGPSEGFHSMVRNSRKNAGQTYIDLLFPGCHIKVCLEGEAIEKSQSSTPLVRFLILHIDPETDHKIITFVHLNSAKEGFEPVATSKSLSSDELQEFIFRNFRESGDGLPELLV